jgi:hypothetical protein
VDAQLGTATFLSAIARGWGLAVKCGACGHEVRWTDRELFRRFGDRLDTAVSRLRPRLVCQCGHRTLILYFYNSGDLESELGFNRSQTAKEEALREMAAQRD